MWDFKNLPLGTVSGTAQDTVEIAIARGIVGLKKEFNQTIDILRFIEGENKRHGLVQEDQVAAFAENIKKAHDYVSSQKSVNISRAGY
jgi:hypothetical protein